MRIFRKKEIPAELPNLAFDKLSGMREQENQNFDSKFKPLPNQDVYYVNLNMQKNSPSIIQKSSKDEQGYFRELIKNVTKGTEKMDKLESWYKKKFMPKDIVFHMKEYWKKQQPETFSKSIIDDPKKKLIEKTDKLHGLEKEWQEIYFNLLSKEEQIRKEERDLKESLGEFMNLFKSNKKGRKG